MGQHLIKFLFVAGLVLSSTACILKQPTDAEDLGKPTSADEINAAVDAAADVDPLKVYHVGDTGIKQRIRDILGNISVLENYQYNVSAVNSQYILYSKLTVESGLTENFKIILDSPTSPVAKFLKTTKRLLASAKRILNKIQVQASTAIGDELRAPQSTAHKVNFAKWPQIQMPTVSTNAHKGLSTKAVNIQSDDFTAQYYGLTIVNHKYPTENCSQIPNCTVNATQIAYNEVQTDKDGKVSRYRRRLEISKEVPGVFMALEVCSSTVLVEGASQLPITECNKVRGFKFGTN